MGDCSKEGLPARLKAARARAAAALAAAALVCLSGCADWPRSEATFVGSATCASCHADQMAAWNESDHKWAMQLPDSAHVLGDFDNASFTHFDDVYRFVHGTEEARGRGSGLWVDVRYCNKGERGRGKSRYDGRSLGLWPRPVTASFGRRQPGTIAGIDRGVGCRGKAMVLALSR